MRRTVDLTKVTYLPHSIQLETSFSNLIVPHDEQLLRLSVHNLIKNAAEACGKTPCVISVKLSRSDQHVSIAINDKGPGVPKEILNKIFEAYTTTKHTGPNPGMGLGLAICQKVVLEHGGTLTVESEPGNTTFKVRLPLKKR
jgi:signal transduction histidine kinase